MKRRKGRRRTTVFLLAAVGCCLSSARATNRRGYAQGISRRAVSETASLRTSSSAASDLNDALLLLPEDGDDEILEEMQDLPAAVQQEEDVGVDATIGTPSAEQEVVVDDDDATTRWDYLWKAFETDEDEDDDGDGFGRGSADDAMIFDSSEILAPSGGTPSEAIPRPEFEEEPTKEEIVVGSTDERDQAEDSVSGAIVEDSITAGAAVAEKVEREDALASGAVTSTKTIGGKEEPEEPPAASDEVERTDEPPSSSKAPVEESRVSSAAEETEAEDDADPDGVVVLNEGQLSQTLRQQTKPHPKLSREVQERLAAQSILPKKSKAATITAPLAPLLLSILPNLKRVASKVTNAPVAVNIMAVFVCVQAMWVPVRRVFFGMRNTRGGDDGWVDSKPVISAQEEDDADEDDDEVAALERQRQQREKRRQREIEAAAARRRRAIQQQQELEEERLRESRQQQPQQQQRRLRSLGKYEDDVTMDDPVDTNIRRENDEDVGSVPTTDSWLPRPRGLFPFRRRRRQEQKSERLPSQRQLADQVQELQATVKTLTSQKEQLEKDYESCSWQLQEAQSEVVSLTASSKYLQTQLYEAQQLVEQTVQMERRRTKAQVASMQRKMLGVVERERESMRLGFEQQTSELQAWVEEQLKKKNSVAGANNTNISGSSNSRRSAKSKTTTTTKKPSSPSLARTTQEE